MMHTSTCKVCLHILMTAVLAVTGTGVHAQGHDYRRGYDDGYRDGAHSARHGAGDRGDWRRRGGIEIDSASYGSRNRRCDVRDSLRAQSRQGAPMIISVNNRLCGDPAPGDRKHLIVRYRCNGGPQLQANANEGRTMTIDC